MTEILAIEPSPASSIIHLHIPGYQPGKKTRSIGDVASLCNGATATRRPTAPLADALSWEGTHKDCGCRRPNWQWCRPCIGHAVAIARLQLDVLTMVAKAGQP